MTKYYAHLQEHIEERRARAGSLEKTEQYKLLSKEEETEKPLTLESVHYTFVGKRKSER